MKKFFAVLLTLTLMLAVAPVSVAKQDLLDPEQAEDGIYDVPGHPELKVRVFVHKEKARPAKPGGSNTQVCNLADTDSTAIVGSTGWKLPAVVNYKLNVSSVPSSVGSGNLATIAGNSFNAWTGAVGGAVTLVNTGNTTVNRAANDGQNIIAWGTTSGSALAVTYTWYNPSTHVVVATDTIMNQKFVWSWSNQAVNPNCAVSNTYDAQDIMTHEIGHWFGLDDEYDPSYANNTMYGYGARAEVKKDTITIGDGAGIDAIYP